MKADNLPLSESEIKALWILKNTDFSKPMRVAKFAELLWPESAMHRRVSNQGNGATTGKAAWLCGGSYLGKLRKKKLVSNHTWSDSYYGYYITKEGKQALAEQTTTLTT